MSAKAPQPTSGDLANWRRLVRAARQAARDPGASAGDLAKAERAARRSIVIGPLTRDSACVQLARVARQYAEATTRQRRDLAGRLDALAGEVEGLAAGGSPGLPPVRRPRADLDG